MPLCLNLGYHVHEAFELVYTKCYCVKRVCCFVNIVFYYVKRLCCYVKKLGYLVYETCELVYTNCYFFNARVVLSTQCLIMLKDYVIMLNTYVVVFSIQCPIMLKSCVIMLKRWVILSTKACELVYTTSYYANGCVVLIT